MRPRGCVRATFFLPAEGGYYFVAIAIESAEARVRYAGECKLLTVGPEPLGMGFWVFAIISNCSQSSWLRAFGRFVPTGTGDGIVGECLLWEINCSIGGMIRMGTYSRA